MSRLQAIKLTMMIVATNAIVTYVLLTLIKFEMALQIASALGISNKNNEDLEYFKYKML